LTLERHYVTFASREPGSRIGKDEWIADSGASTHLATKREMFRDYNLVPGIVEGIDETNSTRSYGRGMVIINSKVNGKIIPITLPNVIFIPDMPNCILSTRRICIAGARLGQTKDSIQIFNESDNLVIEAQQYNAVYIINAKVAPEKETINSMISWNKAHWHYGHISKSSLETIIKNKPVNGLEIDPNSNPNISCEDCLESKAVHIQFPKNATSRGDKPRDLTHCDLWGPYRQLSLKKENYFISFTDDNTRYVTVRYLKKKDDVETEIKNYIEWIKTQFER